MSEANEETSPSECNERVERLVMPQFGAKVKVTAKLRRRIKTEYIENKHGAIKRRKVVKYWHEADFNCEGVYLGTRTLQDGERCYDSEYGGYYFAAEKYHKVALVSPGPNINPVYVPLHGIEA